MTRGRASGKRAAPTWAFPSWTLDVLGSFQAGWICQHPVWAPWGTGHMIPAWEHSEVSRSPCWVLTFPGHRSKVKQTLPEGRPLMALAGQRCVNEPKQSRFSPTGSSVTVIIPFFWGFLFCFWTMDPACSVHRCWCSKHLPQASPSPVLCCDSGLRLYDTWPSGITRNMRLTVASQAMQRRVFNEKWKCHNRSASGVPWNTSQYPGNCLWLEYGLILVRNAAAVTAGRSLSPPWWINRGSMSRPSGIEPSGVWVIHLNQAFFGIPIMG